MRADGNAHIVVETERPARVQPCRRVKRAVRRQDIRHVAAVRLLQKGGQHTRTTDTRTGMSERRRKSRDETTGGGGSNCQRWQKSSRARREGKRPRRIRRGRTICRPSSCRESWLSSLREQTQQLHGRQQAQARSNDRMVDRADQFTKKQQPASDSSSTQHSAMPRARTHAHPRIGERHRVRADGRVDDAVARALALCRREKKGGKMRAQFGSRGRRGDQQATQAQTAPQRARRSRTPGGSASNAAQNCTAACKVRATRDRRPASHSLLAHTMLKQPRRKRTACMTCPWTLQLTATRSKN